MSTFTLLTCEYPPHCGGVGDYTAQVAGALAAAGDEVTVFSPMSAPPLEQRGVEVIALADTYGPDSRQALDAWLEGRSTTIIVQYVPTAFGLRGANLPLCRWLLHRAQQHHDTIQVMFHEPYFKFVWSPVRQNALAVAQRMMARTLLQAASHAYVSTDAWRPCLAPLAPRDGYPFTTLPIPSSIPRSTDSAEAIRARRKTLVTSSSRRLIGHFGTYGSHIAPILTPALATLLSEEPLVSAVCLGAGSDEFVRSLGASAPGLTGRLHATGRASASEIATTLSACDLLVQPYPDGVTTRRTSVMACLINGCPVLTTTGLLTEPVWSETGAVALESAGDTAAFVRSARALLADNDRRSALAVRGERTYRERFALTHTIDKLRESVAGVFA